MKRGDTLTLTCERMNADGAGVAFFGDDVAVLMPGVLPGDRVSAQVEHVSPHKTAQRRQAWARVVEVQSDGPHHVPAPCPAFGTCGGCVWQHMDCAEQLRWKTTLVVEALVERGVNAAVQACVASPVTRGYRNQGKYVVAKDAGGVRLGGYAPRTHDVVDLVGCALVEPAIDVVASAVKERLRTSNVDVRYVVVRANARGQTLLTLVVRDEAEARAPGLAALADAVMADVAGIVGVVANINGSLGDVIFGDRDVVVRGAGVLSDAVAEVDLQLSPRAFFQVNRHVAALAYEAIAAFARTLPQAACVWDVYAGVGTIARVIAQREPRVKNVVCVEIRPTAVDDARAAWKDASGAHFEAVAGDAATILASAASRPDVVVLNPPRAGCDEQVLNGVAARAPEGIAYLSCNPKTLARDLGTLATLGYAVAQVVPFDMLPDTPHVETLATLRLR
ncbi:MAG: 23S rRNA (uracil(1939)-C(5))-methyltransferase RlmD [Deltaproteobacteria bacterium]|nr:23S rRNA (uracil(1939)-C(5))-methyltransferase RlmD [Deltaproteobacteria bacterium]